MSFSPAIYAFQAIDFPSPRPLPRREFPRKAPPGPAPHTRSRAEHPVLFMGGFLLAISLVVIGLWQGLGLLLPH
jgi:hypothetical protein